MTISNMPFLPRTALPLAIALLLAASAAAQTPAGMAQAPGEPATSRPGLLGKIAIDQRLNPNVERACHVLGLEMPYAQIEKMANLDLLPPHGFTVIAMPIKIYRGSAGFVRAVALVPK